MSRNATHPDRFLRWNGLNFHPPSAPRPLPILFRLFLFLLPVPRCVQLIAVVCCVWWSARGVVTVTVMPGQALASNAVGLVLVQQYYCSTRWLFGYVAGLLKVKDWATAVVWLVFVAQPTHPVSHVLVLLLPDTHYYCNLRKYNTE